MLCVVWDGSAALRERVVFETSSVSLKTGSTGSIVSLQIADNQQVKETDGFPSLIRRYLVKSGEFDSISADRVGRSVIGEGLVLQLTPEIATFAGDLGRDADFYVRELSNLDNGTVPGSGAYVIDRGRDRGREIVTIGIQPLEFCTETGTLAAYSSIQLDFHGSPDLVLEQVFDSGSPMGSSPQRGSAALSSTAGAAEYLIVTRSDFADAFSDLVKWKREKGLGVEVATIGDIVSNNSGRDDAERLRNFLIGRYNDGVKYVLLGGDETVLPIRYAYHANTSVQPSLDLMNICDLYFGDVDGNWDLDGDGIYGEPSQDQPDIYAELLIGRLPFHQLSQFKDYIEKLINYEQNPGGGSYDYLNRALFIAADQMRDYQGVGQQTLLAAAYPGYVTSDLSDVVEAPTGDAANPATPLAPSAIQTMSSGWGMMTLLIHGVSDGWVLRSNVYNEWPKSYLFTAAGTDGDHGFLPNIASNGKPGVIYSIGCDNAAFDMDAPPFAPTNPCVAELFLGKPNGGAVCFVGYTRWGWVASSWKLEDAFIDYLYNQNNNAAEAVRYSKAQFPYYRDLCYGLNYYGDPELSVWTNTPQAVQVSTNKITQTGEIEIEAIVRSGSEAVAGAFVTVTKDDQIIGQAVSGGDGSVIIPIEFDLAGEFVVMAYKSGCAVASAPLIPEIVLGADDETNNTLPESFALYQNFPNPFNPATTIRFDAPSTAPVVIEIYNVLGQLISVVFDAYAAAGSHEVEWNGADLSGREVSSGVYFARLSSPGFSRAIKMSLLK